MEAETLSNFNEAEEGEILSENDDAEELYIPLERPHIASSNALASTSLPSNESDDESALKESSSDSDSSTKNLNFSKIRRTSIKVSGVKKKNYNIWSSDIQTEVLTNFLVDCNVDQSIDRCRDVESYNYRLGRFNNENKFKSSFTNNDSKKKQEYSAKRRHDGAFVGEKVKVTNVEKEMKNVQSSGRNILSLSTNFHNSEEEIARDIANKLCETKEDLILRALNILGKEVVFALFEETKNVEASGGIMVMNGTRRRTPGGVFFYLLKTSEHVPRDKINLVLLNDKKAAVEEKKLKAKKNRQLQAEKFRQSLTQDDFPTLLSRTELAIKVFKAKKLAEDSGEVKNPPPSPATDGRECSSDGEEQKEGNDNNSGRKCTETRTLTYDENLFNNEDSCGMDVF